jgi:nucleoside-diphosphate-sugar epimerase
VKVLVTGGAGFIGSHLAARLELEARASDIKHSHASIELARELIGYGPHVELREGLRRTIEHYASGAGPARARSRRPRP